MVRNTRGSTGGWTGLVLRRTTSPPPKQQQQQQQHSATMKSILCYPDTVLPDLRLFLKNEAGEK